MNFLEGSESSGTLVFGQEGTRFPDSDAQVAKVVINV
jgi:hypothetical protein